MSRLKSTFIVLCCGAAIATVVPLAGRQAPPPLGPLTLPAGFRAEVFAENVQNARSMALGAQRSTSPSRSRTAFIV